MDIEAFRKAGYEAIDQICDYYSGLEQRPVMAQVQPGFLREALPPQAPEQGEPWSVISRDYQTKILPGITHWQHPMFFAYFPANTTFEGMLADLHAAAISNPGFNWAVSPSVTELELITLDWIAKLLGLSDAFLTAQPSLGGGIILNSASEVAITVTVAARERALAMIERQEKDHENESANSHGQGNGNGHTHGKGNSPAYKSNIDDVAAWRGEQTGKLVMYGTTQTHSIGAKAAMILGLSFHAIEVTAKDDYALRGHALIKAIEQDKAKGLTPFMLIATIGSTSSGAIDRLDEIEEACATHCPSLWIHVDSAYAGVCLALEEMRKTCYLDVINRRVDSFSTNLHKWGLVNFDCSPLHVRRRADLSNALTVTPEFLRTKHGDAGSVLDLRNMQLSLGRRFRSLKVWFVLRSYGLQGFRSHLRRHIELSGEFNTMLRKRNDAPLSIVAKPRWALTVFRIEPKWMMRMENAVDRTAQLDALNRRFWDALQEHNATLLLTQTVLPEVGFCIRFSIGSASTQLEHVERAYELICQVANECL